MRETIIPSNRPARKTVRPNSDFGILSGFARKALFSRLKNLVTGRLVLREGEKSFAFGESDNTPDFTATVFVHDRAFYTDVVFGGSIGAGESYMAGFWSTDDLTQLIRIIIRNKQVLTGIEGGPTRHSELMHRVYHHFRKNSRKGSRKNILAHYDLGNDFYSLFLDETMTYSCGIFASPDHSLREASIEKYDRICRKLRLCAGDQVLEIGGGWGGFALHAAKHYGCHVTTTTISDQQYAFAHERIQQDGLGNRIELLLKDYRDLQGAYDKLVSIEMIEAVGHHYLETFFGCCSALLKEEGVMALQAIIIDDRVYDSHKRSVDFIKRYIFPGSCIPSVTAISQAVTAGTNMRLVHLEDITPHYAQTLREWRERFFSNISDVRRLGYSEQFIKMWDYYLSYCEAGFSEHYIGDVQMLFKKPLSNHTLLMLPLKGDDQP